MKKPKILLVEDNFISQKLTLALLENAGYAVICTDNAEEGVELAKAELPDLILMDIRLPGMDGMTATSLLKSQPPTSRIPVLAYTAFAMRGDAEKAYGVGCDFYITKPIDTRQFIETIAYFTKHKPTQSKERSKAAVQREVLLGQAPENRTPELEMIVTSLGHTLNPTPGGLPLLRSVSPSVDLVILDMDQPTIDSLDTLQRLRSDSRWRLVPVLALTADTTDSCRQTCLDYGADDVILKPVDRNDLRTRCKNLLRMKEALDLRRNETDKEEGLREREAALRRAVMLSTASKRRLYKANIESIQRLSLAAEYRDDDTGSHIQRISLYSELIGKALRLPRNTVKNLRISAPMHDIGKIGIPDNILLKPGPLTPEERSTMQMHTEIGAKILRGSDSEFMRVGEVIAATHHERYDGKGYPNGLAGEDIPLYGRICAVADVYDALTSKRPYKSAMNTNQALEVMREERGRHFDPVILDAFMDNLTEIRAIRDSHED